MRPREYLVLCGGAETEGRGSARALQLQLHGPAANVELRIQDLSTPLGANIPDQLLDLLEVATYVFAADAAISRGGKTDTRLGSFWRRAVRLRIPVRRPDLWASEPVSSALVEMLGFLSDDDYAFEFLPIRGRPQLQGYLEFTADGDGAFQPDGVILFSGGLDSLAGAVDDLATHGRAVALVSHRSSGKVAAAQSYLVDQLRLRFGPDRVRHVAVWASLVDGDLAREHTHRTRSFLFAALGAVTARLFGLDRVGFFENGVVSLNLPLAAQVVGVRATRTTHPQALAGFRAVLSALLGRPFEVANPFVWLTKAVVVGRVAANGLGELIPHTRSCTRVRDMTKIHPHCGLCSQCVDRRVGILAAGLDRFDSADGYAVDLFQGSRPPGPDQELVLAYMRTAARISRMNDVAFFSHYGEANRAVRFFAEPAGTVAERMFELHESHAQGVVSALEQAFVANARALAEWKLPPDCLLRLAGHPGSERIEAPVAAALTGGSERPPGPFGALPSTAPPTSATVISMSIDPDGEVVQLQGWGVVKGVGAKVLIVLAESFRAAVRAELPPKRFPFMPTKKLMQRLGCDGEETLRRRILRLRVSLEAFARSSGRMPPPIDAIVENVPRRGYRLNPERVRVVAPDPSRH